MSSDFTPGVVYLEMKPEILALPLRLEARFTLLWLHHFSDQQGGGDCIISLSLLAHHGGCSESSVRRQLNHLIDAAHVVHGGWRGAGRFVFRLIDLGGDYGNDDDDIPQPTPDTTPGVVARTQQDAVSPPTPHVQAVLGYPTEHKKQHVPPDSEAQPTPDAECLQSTTSDPESNPAAIPERSRTTSKSQDLAQAHPSEGRLSTDRIVDVMSVQLTEDEEARMKKKKFKLIEVIGEARFSPEVAERVARAEVLELVPHSAVVRAFQNASDKKSQGQTPARYIYFAGAMKRKFEELGLHWASVTATETFTQSLLRRVKRAS